MKEGTLILMLSASVALYSCNGNKTSGSEASSKTQTVQTLPPVSIAFLDDKSGSVKAHGIPPLTYNDLQPAISYVVKNGGAVMVGLIAANSDYSTVQLRIEKSLEPVRPIAPEKSQFNNIFDYHHASLNFNNVTLPAYQSDSTVYIANIKNKLNEFQEQVNDLLHKNLGSNATDIADAINRSIDFHATAPKGCEHYTILISDGIENTNRSKVTNSGSLSILYLLAGGSPRRCGEWLKECNPEVTPDLATALSEIGMNN